MDFQDVEFLPLVGELLMGFQDVDFLPLVGGL